MGQNSTVIQLMFNLFLPVPEKQRVQISVFPYKTEKKRKAVVCL